MTNQTLVPVFPISSEENETISKLDEKFMQLYGHTPDFYVSVPGR